MMRWLKRGRWFDYHTLSWRQKFVRTLWVGPVSVVLLLAVADLVLTFEGGVEDARPLRWVAYALVGAVAWLYAEQLIRSDRRSRQEPPPEAIPLPAASG